MNSASRATAAAAAADDAAVNAYNGLLPAETYGTHGTYMGTFAAADAGRSIDFHFKGAGQQLAKMMQKRAECANRTEVIAVTPAAFGK